jgi:hypothetical protein
MGRRFFGGRVMRIIEGWNGERTLWIVQERWATDRERETAFANEGNAKVYRDLVRAERRTSDARKQQRLAEKIASMRADAFSRIGES